MQARCYTSILSIRHTRELCQNVSNILSNFFIVTAPWFCSFLASDIVMKFRRGHVHVEYGWGLKHSRISTKNDTIIRKMASHLLVKEHHVKASQQRRQCWLPGCTSYRRRVASLGTGELLLRTQSAKVRRANCRSNLSNLPQSLLGACTVSIPLMHLSTDDNNSFAITRKNF